MKQKGFASLLILVGIAVIILIGGVVVYQKVFIPQAQPSPVLPIPTPNLTAGWVSQKACLENNGKWAEDYKECGGINQDVCQGIGGKFNDCASPCRHDSQVENCIMMCEEICSF